MLLLKYLDELYLFTIDLDEAVPVGRWTPGDHSAVLVCGVVPASMGPLPGAQNQGQAGALQIVVESCLD